MKKTFWYGLTVAVLCVICELGYACVSISILNAQLAESNKVIPAFGQKPLVASNSENGNGEVAEGKQYGKIVDAVIALLRDQYIDDIKDDIYKEALNGIMSSLDPHSAFFTEKEFAEMRVQTKGEFGGLGIVVTKDNLNLIKIVSPIDNTPASRAGVLAGDYISEINGETTYNMPLNDAVERMRGKVGEKVKIVILRNGADKPIELVLKREIIKTQSVKGEMKADNIIYMRITNFIETTDSDFMKTFSKIILENKNKKISGVVLDLRNNPGGLLNQAVRISEFFLEKEKPVVFIKGKNQALLDEFRSTVEKPILEPQIPMVVLVNGGSASASEIVAGALQDHKRAIVLGETTFGKASVQQIFPMNDGSALKITIARYYTPNGRSLQLDGIVPDIIVKDAEVKYSDNSFNLREENLKGRLDRAPVDIITKTLSERREKEKEKKKNEKTEEVTDYQLSRALDLIKGINIFSGNATDVADAKKDN